MHAFAGHGRRRRFDTIPLLLPLQQQQTPKHTCTKKHTTQQCRIVAYGAGMVGGALILHALRRRLSRLPIIGVVAQPLLGAFCFAYVLWGGWCKTVLV
jgi:hypothetical protein